MKTKIELQQEYCTKKNLPLFAPEDGICFSCNNNIFNKLSEEECSNELITGCPYCHHSYCE